MQQLSIGHIHETYIIELENDSAIAKHLSDARVEMAKEVDAINENGIRQMRMNLGWSQSRLANEIGTTQAHIARIESGKSDVQMGTLIRIAAALGVNAKEVCAAYLVYCSAAS